MNLRDTINNYTRQLEPVDAFGTTVYLRRLRADEANALGDTEDNDEQPAYRVLALTLCDKDGGRLYADDEIAEIAALPARDLGRVVERAMQLNGFSEEDRVGNSEGTTADATSSN